MEGVATLSDVVGREDFQYQSQGNGIEALALRTGCGTHSEASLGNSGVANNTVLT